MEKDQRLDRKDLRRRQPKPPQPRTPAFSNSSTHRSSVANLTSRYSDPWPTEHAYAHPEQPSSIFSELPMFIACSWEPALLSLPTNRQMISHERSLLSESNTYGSTPVFPQDVGTFENISSSFSSFSNIMTTSEQPIFDCDATQMGPTRRTSGLDQNTLSPSHISMTYGTQASPRSYTTNKNSRVCSRPLQNALSYQDYTPAVHAAPAVWHSHRTSHNKSLENTCTEQTESCDKPYAYFLYEALSSAKDHRLSLQEIYRWFEDNTNKAHDPNFKGWQSSIRHNLSMNEAFVMWNEPSGHGKPKMNYWTLTEEALRNGIQSTTRYRNSVSKRSPRTEAVTSQRSKSGRKGGSTPRFAQRSRRINHRSDVEANEQPYLSQQPGSQVPIVDIYGPKVRISMPMQRLTPGTSTNFSSEGSQLGFARSYGPDSNTDGHLPS